MAKVRRQRRKGARPSTQPRPAGALMDGTFRWLKIDDNMRSFRAMRAFATAAGARIGGHARAERLRGSILYVRCDSSAWTQHLHVMKESLLERLHKTPGGEGVAELRFNVGPLDEVAGWEAPATGAPASRRRASRRCCPRRSRARSATSRIRCCATS